MTDTIYALASGSVRAGVAVVRVSGPATVPALRALTGEPPPPPRMAALCTLGDGEKKLDRAIVLYFKAPASFTGEDVAEFHLHGGRAVVDAVCAALSRVPGCRMAEGGEFTRRAFENGKMDLTAAEAVADLIAAETEAQRAQAFAQMEGSLFRVYSGWAARLKHILAHQEADIEFPDEDLPDGISGNLREDIETLHGEIAAHIGDRRGERLRDGVAIAILGAPNAGKSSLLNALAKRDAAIVSETAGTTRDVIEVHLDLGGYPVILSDTAGLRETDNDIEAEGIRRAAAAAGRADLKIALFDAAREQDRATLDMVDENTITVFSKLDLAPAPLAQAGLHVSTLTGAGMDDLVALLTQKIKDMFHARPGPAPTRARHREALEEAGEALARALSATLPELAAEDLRLALRALGRITGHVHVEQLLDTIFRDFCIGK